MTKSAVDWGEKVFEKAPVMPIVPKSCPETAGIDAGAGCFCHAFFHCGRCGLNRADLERIIAQE